MTKRRFRVLLFASVAGLVSGVRAELKLVSPADGAVVETLRAGQAEYLAKPRAERWRAMEDVDARRRLVAVGSTQAPLELSWTGAEPGSVELEIVPEGGEPERFRIERGASARITNLEVGRRYRWSVRSGDAVASASFATSERGPRTLLVDGVSNFRDLGGWKTTDGRRVRQNLIFRSSGLRASARNRSSSVFDARYQAGVVRLTPAGARTLREDLKVRTDIELRSRQESAAMTASQLGSDVAWLRIPFTAYEFVDGLANGREPFARLFETFSDASSYPILMHCSGGRDRTGTLAFLLNGLLGVPEKDLLRDWEFSIFSDEGGDFTSARIERLLDYLGKLPGDTLQERIASYVRSCGVLDEQVEAFRKIMLDL